MVESGAIEVTDAEVLIIGTSPNFFTIPSRAFEHDEERTLFIDEARAYWTRVHGRAAV